MSRIFTVFFFSILSGFLSAQIITTSPVLPVDSKAVTITYDATQGNKGLMGFTGDVYAHTGVITDKSTSGSDWKYVKANWLTDIPACKLTRIAADKYQLSISPSIREFYGVPAGEKILKMAFVFRNSGGTVSGRDLKDADIFVNVYQEGINVDFIKPAGLFSIVSENTNLDIQVSASGNDSICLFLDNTKIKSAASQQLSNSILVSGTQKHMLVAVAYKGTSTNSDTTYYLAPAPVTTATLPAAARDGISYPDNQSATLVLFAPYKTRIFVIGDFNNWIPDNTYQMKRDRDRFWITLSGLTSGKEYRFQYLIDDTLRIADPYTEKTSDPEDRYIPSSIYPNLLSYTSTKTSEIASVLQTGQPPFAWTTSNFVPPSKDKLVIYELLIRDFTANKDIKTVTDTLSYLKRLGINAIELMPFNEFEGNDSWGYNPSFYFAPDKAYGTKDDYKKFIDACHKNGIAVIQDLVLNHTYGQSPFLRMYFENGKPSAINPWYNQTSNMQNPSLQFGYDLNHNSTYTRKLVDSVASFWMSEYKIDGFRYDFTKGFSNTPYGPNDWASAYDAERVSNLKRMTSEVWKRKANAYVIFEHLADNSEETELANYGILLWGNMNYNYNEATMGFIPNSNFSWISYKLRGWNSPNLVGYMESHDEERLMYKNENFGNASGPSYNIKDVNTGLNRMKLAATFFFPIPGPKMIWEFGELGYDTSINKGGRLAAKPPKWDYYSNPERRKLYNTFKALITLKTTEPLFTTSDFTLNTAGSVKDIVWNSGNDHAVAIGNFDVVSQTTTYIFPASGKWYEFFKGDSISLTGTTYTFNLQPGEYRLYSTKRFAGSGSLVTAVNPVIEKSNDLFFPNPAHDEINFTGDLIREITIFSISGSKLKEIKNPGDQILIDELANGIYMMNIKYYSGKSNIVKFVKK